MSFRGNITTFDWLSHYMVTDNAYNKTKKNRERENALFEWIEQCVKNNNYSMRNGILGMGFLVSYLTKKLILDLNISEYLEDVDDCIYRYTLQVIANKEATVEDITELVDYYQMRLSVKDSLTFNRTVPLSRCLNLLQNREVRFLNNFDSLSENVHQLLRFSFSFGTFLDEKIVSDLFYSKAEITLILLKDTFAKETINPCDKESLLKFLLMAKQINRNYWIEEANGILLNFSESDFYDTDDFSLGILFRAVNDFSNINLSIFENINSQKYERTKYTLYQFITLIKMRDFDIELVNS